MWVGIRLVVVLVVALTVTYVYLPVVVICMWPLLCLIIAGCLARVTVSFVPPRIKAPLQITAAFVVAERERETQVGGRLQAATVYVILLAE